MQFLRSNTAVIITVGPFLDATDGVSIEDALTITNELITLTADTDDGNAPTLILDNIAGATSGTANDLNYITNEDAGYMQLELAAANVNRVGRMHLSITDAAHVPVFHEFFVLPQVIYDWLTTGAAPLSPTVAGRTLDVSAGGEAGVDWANVGSPTTTVGLSGTTVKTATDVETDTAAIEAAVITNAAGTDIAADIIALKAETAAILVDTGTTLDGRIPAALVSGRMDASVGAMAANVLTASAVAAGAIDAATFAADTGLVPLDSGTAQGDGGAANTIQLAAGAEPSDTWVGSWLVITGGAGAGQAGVIISFNGIARTATIDHDWASAVDNTSTYVVKPSASVNVAAVGAAAPTVQTAGNLSAQIDAVDNFVDGEVTAILEDTGTTLDDLVDDLEGRLSAALATALTAHSLAVGRGVVDAGSSTTALIIKTINGAAADATPDHYNGRHIVFTSGALLLQATEITDYVGATKTATITAVTDTPAEDVTFVIV